MAGFVRVQPWHDTAANWTANNPVLRAGEIGYETDTGLVKRGDGTSPWSSLTYTLSESTADASVAGLVNDDASSTRVALDAVYPTLSYADASYARAGSVVRPVVQRTNPDSMILTNGGGSTAGTGTQNLTDTTDFALGSSAATITSSGGGTFRLYNFSTAAPLPWDMSGSWLRLVIEVPDYTNLNELYVYAGDSGGSNYFKWNISEASTVETKRIIRQGVWTVLDLARDDATPVGAPSWSSIALVRVFFTDKNATPVTVRVNGIGKVPDPAGLPNGAVVFTFDDLDPSQFTYAKPKLDSYGVPGVMFPIDVIADAGTGVTIDQMRNLRDLSGWEIGAHAWDNTEHAAGLAGKTESDLRTVFDRLKTWNAQNGFASDSFAWPNGDSDPLAQRVAREYFSTGRGVVNGTQSPHFANPMNLRSWSKPTAVSAQTQIDRAKASQGVVVFVYHRIVTSSPSGNDVLKSDFDGAVDYAVAQGVPILTMQDVLTALGKV